METADAFPRRAVAIREDEVAEHALEVVFIKDRDVPEHTLVTASGGGLIERVNDVLEVVLDLEGVHGEIVIAVVLAGEVIEAVEKLDGGAGTGQVGGDSEDEVDEAAAEGGEVFGCLAFAAERYQAMI